MKVLVVNAGSSSLKYQLVEMDNESVICKGVIERVGMDGSKIIHKVGEKKVEILQPLANHTEAFNLLMSCLTDKKIGVIESADEISAIGHRLVHSGEAFDKSIYVGDEELLTLDSIAHLAPLHMPANISCIRSCKQILPKVPNIAVFDTAFHSTMPHKASMYAIPYEDYQNYQIRRYGFHGTSHRYVSGLAIKYLQSIGAKAEKIVTCHLGNGSSISAILNGKCIDTSMGMTPLEGVPMGTRSGDIDASVVEMLMNYKHMSASEVINYLNKKSGFLGVSGVSSDARDLCQSAKEGNERSILARDMFAYRVKKFIGGYCAAMNGLDCIVMTGGIGENSEEFRSAILHDLEGLGVVLNDEINNSKEAHGKFIELDAKESRVKILVIPTNEELVIARDTLDIVTNMKK